MIRYSCPHCGERLEVDDAKAGKAFVCSLCAKSSLVPGGQPAQPPGQEGVARQDFGQQPLPPAPTAYADPLASLNAWWNGLSTQDRNGFRILGMLTFAVVILPMLVSSGGGASRHSPPPARSYQPASPPPPPSTDLQEYWRSDLGAFWIAPADFVRCVQANEISADFRAKGRAFYMDGVIDGINQGGLGGLYLTLSGGVRCHFDIGQEGQFVGRSVGDPVVVRGTLLGHANSRSIEHCQFVQRNSAG